MFLIFPRWFCCILCFHGFSKLSFIISSLFTELIHMLSWRKRSQLEGYKFREVQFTLWHWVVGTKLLGEQLLWYVATLSIFLLFYRIFCIFCYCFNLFFSLQQPDQDYFVFLNHIKSQISKLALPLTKFQLSHWNCFFMPPLPWWLGQVQLCWKWT